MHNTDSPTSSSRPSDVKKWYSYAGTNFFIGVGFFVISAIFFYYGVALKLCLNPTCPAFTLEDDLLIAGMLVFGIAWILFFPLTVFLDITDRMRRRNNVQSF